jgi:hypothetical protein
MSVTALAPQHRVDGGCDVGAFLPTAIEIAKPAS